MTDGEEMRKSMEYLAEQSAKMIAAMSRGVVEKDFIADKAVMHWRNSDFPDLDFYLCLNRLYYEINDEAFKATLRKAGISETSITAGPFNGYAKFPKLPGILPGYRGIYTYVPVHGNITFFQEWADGSCTYGFDCGHSISDPAITSDKGWMRLETESMARGIMIAARFERYYLNAGDDNYKKARVLDRMGRFMPFDWRDNLGVMLNLLSGEL